MTRNNYVTVDLTKSPMVIEGAISKLHPISSMIPNVSTDTLSQVMEHSIACYSSSPDVYYDLLDVLYRSAFQCTQNDFQGSLLLSWVVIEKAQNKLWESFIKGGYKNTNSNTNITGERKKVLLKGHDYTASIKSQILSICAYYTDAELNLIDEVRKVRNDLMHNLGHVSQDIALKATSCAMEMASKVFGKKILFNAALNLGIVWK